MKILILGGAGMLGHELCRRFTREQDVFVTLRTSAAGVQSNVFNRARLITGVEATNETAMRRVLDHVKAEVVLNCIGVIKQRDEAKNATVSIRVNSLLPHVLWEWCSANAARLIHFSTDCVFSGRKGAYIETDVPDAEDLYGRSKLLGEITGAPGLTLRSSIIGRELGSQRALLEWFLAQAGKTIRGYRRAIYSGFTTTEMARIVDRIVHLHPNLHGVWQVASAPISKYDLLCLVRDKFALKVEIEPFDDFVCDRSLNADRFNATTGYVPPTWDKMIEELATRERDQTS
jgi:dTDP-4-dehydrorhamnose reductase